MNFLTEAARRSLPLSLLLFFMHSCYLGAFCNYTGLMSLNWLQKGYVKKAVLEETAE